MNRGHTALQHWLDSPLGQQLLQQESAVVAQALERVFGVQAVQVGSWGAHDQFLRHARTRRAALVATPVTPGAVLCCEPWALPLQSDSVDALMLPHTLEFTTDPHEVLREAGRVLTPEGELLVLGFEPLGFWGLRHALSPAGFPRGLSRTLTAGKLGDWLKLLGFEMGGTERFLYAPPLAGMQQGRARLAFDFCGLRLWPRLSGAYLLRARKRLHGLTPLRMRYRVRTAVIGGLVEPAARRSA